MKLKNTYAIVWNAPIGVGKDVALEYVSNMYPSMIRKETKDHLHRITQEFFCIDPTTYWSLYNNRDTKEVPNPLYTITQTNIDLDLLYRSLGLSTYKDIIEWSATHRPNPRSYELILSPREAMIYISEVVIKPRKGDDYFGVARCSKICEGDIILDASASSFPNKSTGELTWDEGTPLKSLIGSENILLIRVHREGYTFEGDSRNYIEDTVDLKGVDIYNDSTEKVFLDKNYQIIKQWLEERGL